MVCKAKVTSRVYTAGELVTGFHTSFPIAPCNCGNPCRRVALWADRPFHLAEPASLIMLRGRVTFGDDCDGLYVEVDWKTGVVLDLFGCYAQVELHVPFALIDPADATQRFLIKSMVACCGAGAARGTATWTSAPQSEGTATIEIPPFAYALDRAFTDQGNATATWITSGGLVIGAANAGDSVPEGAVAIQFTVGMGETGFARFFIGV